MIVGYNTHMKQSTYVKITGLAENQKRQYASEAALAGLSLSAYLLRLIEKARKKQVCGCLRTARKASQEPESRQLRGG